MEQFLWCKYPNRFDLYVQDYASNAHRWLRQFLPSHRILSADVGGDKLCYDLIYLSGVDYSLQDDELIDLLSAVKSRLNANGTVVMISASFIDEQPMEYLLRLAKEFAKASLEFFRLYNRGQFWGFLRSRDEYNIIMERAGFT